jgi:hypothetical protein
MSDVRSELEKIRKEHGKLTPEVVKEAVRPKEHPLHARVFDLKAKEASEAWYRHRAHELIQSVYRVVDNRIEGQPPLRIREYYAVQSEGPDSYVYESLDEVVQSDFTLALVRRNLEREWKQLWEKGKAFDEFIEMVRGDLGEEEAA